MLFDAWSHQSQGPAQRRRVSDRKGISLGEVRLAPILFYNDNHYLLFVVSPKERSEFYCDFLGLARAEEFDSIKKSTQSI